MSKNLQTFRKTASQPNSVAKTKALATHEIMISSFTGSAVTRILLNGVEVAATRIIKDTLACTPQGCLSPQDRTKCPECLPSRNIFKVIPYLIKNNGFSVMYNGINSNVPLTFVRTLTFLPAYEFRKIQKLKIQSKKVEKSIFFEKIESSETRTGC